MILIKTLTAKYIWVGMLVVILVAIAFANYQPGKWLSGWDTLHPEFNFALNIERLLFGVFRPEQGLGAVAAQSHMADLPRVLLLALSSLVIPQSLLRYFFIMLYLAVGVLGVYFFIEKGLLAQSNSKFRQKAAFLGGLFYLFNLGTLQHFVVVLEMFAVEYAFLPWLFLAAVSYLRKQSKKKLVLFALVALLAAPMAHTATLWYVFLLVFVLFLVPFFKKNGATVLLIVLLAVNSFWLLPNLYFLKSSAFFVPQAKVNKIFSEEAFAHNQNYGKLLDVIIFKNFLFDWKIYSGVENDQYDDLLAGFKKHLQKTEVLGIGYLAAILVFLGMLIAWKENNFSKVMVLPAVVVIVFLANNNFIFNLFFSLFKLLLPFLGEALRLPFTKFSIPLMFFFACFFALGAQKLLDKANNYANISLFFISLLLVFYCWPFFKGELISKQMQVNIPKEYFAVFDWFNIQPEGRVVQLPIHSFWNWIYYSWGFQGAYFTPFGIKQPVLDRDYDRWNLDNERAFRELSYAVYSQDVALFDSVLSKYQIAYLLLDKNVLAPGLNQDKKVLFNSQLESMLLSAGDRIKLARRFNNISIYQVIKPAPIVRSAKKFTTISTINKGADIDWVYKNSGDYIVSSAASSFYPFYAISDNQNFLTKDFANLSEIFQGQNILSSDYLNYEQYLPLDVYAAFDNNTLTIKLATKLSKNKKTMQFSHPIQPTDDQYGFLSLDNHQNLKLKELKKDFTYQGSFYLSTKAVNNLSFYSYQSVWQKDNFQIIVQPELCKPSSFAEAGLSILQDGYKLSAKNTSSCIRISLSKLLEDSSINSLRSLLQIDFKVKPVNLEMTGHYCLFDKTVKRCVKEKKGILAGAVFDYLTLGAGDIDKWDLILYADNVGKLQTKEIIYQDLAVQVKQLEASWTIVSEDIKELLGKNLHLEKETILSLWEKMPNTEVEVLGKGHPVTSCSENSPQRSDRIRNTPKAYLEYQSTNGSLCDYFSFPNLPHNLGYLVSLQTQAVSGLPLRVCLANPYSKRCDIFSVLPKNNQFQEDVIVVPPAGDGGVGYELHLTNYSIGQTPSINRIKELKITPFPYYWLTNLQFGNKNQSSQNSFMKVLNYQKVLPFFYVVNVINPGSDPGLLVLDNSFEAGWVSTSGQHVLVNNWANGWKIDKQGYQQIVIFFWPQLLQFIGFTLAVAVLVALLTKGRRYG